MCLPELVFPVLYYKWNSDYAVIFAMLLLAAGLVQVPLMWVLLKKLWSKASAPRRRKSECTIALALATAVYLRILLVVLTFRT